MGPGGLEAERIFRAYYRFHRENPIPPFQVNFETIDETGFIWAWLAEADNPSLIEPGVKLVFVRGRGRLPG